MKVLILGGTGESRELARRLDSLEDIDVVSSLAGRVANPVLPIGDTRVGGFGGVDGLAEWLRRSGVDVVVDATHPFAARMSSNAVAAAAREAVPLVVLQRPPWTPDDREEWGSVDSGAAAAQLVGKRWRRAFLTIGRQGVSDFAGLDDCWFLIRSIDPPGDVLPRQHSLILDRGPFDVAHEIDLMREHRIDVLVTKNSGGPMTRAKLGAARELGVPVVMIERPARPSGDFDTSSVDAAVHWLSGRARLRVAP